MKILNLFLTSAFILAVVSVHAQDLSENDVPNAVRSAFSQEFPETSQAEWEMEKGNYKVEFNTTNNFENEVWYDASGKFIRSERQVFANDLPMDVLSKIRTEYRDYSMDDVKEVVVNGKKSYKLELSARKSDKEIKLHFDEQGNILKSK